MPAYTKSRRTAALLCATLVLTLGAALAGCGPQEDPPMSSMLTNRTPVAIPALDAAAPAHIETATLALG